MGNTVLRRVFRPKEEEVVEDCRRLRNKELHNLCTSPNTGDKVKEVEIGRACSTHGRDEIFVQFSGQET
jgi:hypothetical protein